MENKGFYCPRCSRRLSNDDNTIVKLKGRLSSEFFSVHFNIDLPAKLGDYGAVLSEGVILKKGADIDFLCPYCVSDLSMEKMPNHAWLKMKDGEEEEKVVIFNKVYGEHSSFVINTENHDIIKQFGEHSDEYKNEFNKDLNFFGF